jgi:hypothetical protein
MLFKLQKLCSAAFDINKFLLQSNRHNKAPAALDYQL